MKSFETLYLFLIFYVQINGIFVDNLLRKRDQLINTNPETSIADNLPLNRYTVLSMQKKQSIQLQVIDKILDNLEYLKKMMAYDTKTIANNVVSIEKSNLQKRLELLLGMRKNHDSSAKYERDNLPLKRFLNRNLVDDSGDPGSRDDHGHSEPTLFQNFDFNGDPSAKDEHEHEDPSLKQFENRNVVNDDGDPGSRDDHSHSEPSLFQNLDYNGDPGTKDEHGHNDLLSHKFKNMYDNDINIDERNNQNEKYYRFLVRNLVKRKLLNQRLKSDEDLKIDKMNTLVL